jgi:hypothetical protein
VQRLEKCLSDFFLSRFQEAEGKDTAVFNHFVRFMRRINAIDYQWRLEGRLRYPACGKTVNVFPILNAAHIDAVGNFAQYCLFCLFV